mmetsp:Transcript_16840/g.48555  ORF Transcript_16840/g.48555 Transcript_16840/m.48555 type:complete len:95 (+) Transcript_16840:2383-2667(+)
MDLVCFYAIIADETNVSISKREYSSKTCEGALEENYDRHLAVTDFRLRRSDVLVGDALPWQPVTPINAVTEERTWSDEQDTLVHLQIMKEPFLR